ncbi:hypothetical protein KAR91_79545 [Candidatus Pacearchaeota archaeon]|nr:hypothetical protein [Candidatus Pacearchaeota archaeon]
MFLRKKPKRLYYPSKSSWYTKPRRKSSVKKRTKKLFKGNIKKAFKKWFKKSLFGAIVVGLFIAFLLFLLFSSYFTVTKIEVVRESFNVDSAAIENELSQFIGKNILFFPRSQIYGVVHEKFPEFERVEVHKFFPSTFKIELTSYPIVANLKAYYVLPEAEEIMEEDFTELNKAIEELSGIDPSLIDALETDHPLSDDDVADAIFDIEDKDKEATEQRSLLNQVGQAIFDREENLELMSISVRGLTQPIEDRELVIEPDHMNYILQIIQYFANNMNVEVSGVEYLPVAREIHLKTKDNLVLWVSLDRDFKGQVDKLNTIYEAAELNKEDLSYIDLRVKEKIIYCPRYASCDK